YSRFATVGVTLMGVIDVALFGLVPGALIFVTQIAWIPFWAAGVINGIGHYFGYRNFDVGDASKNIVPFGILIGGEELHNNHHAYATSAKLSAKWYEFDIGWMYIRILEALGLATVKKVAPTPRFEPAKTMCDYQTLQAVIANRYDVLASYTKAVKRTLHAEVERLQHWSPSDAALLKSLKRALVRIGYGAETDRAKVAEALKPSRPLQVAVSMREELIALWERSNASKEQLLRHLQDWCHRAEESGVEALVEFSRRLRSYA
ncbi:MAG: transposase, partial [Burkholderiales bacterium]